MITKLVRLVTATLLTATGVALGGLAAASPAAAAVQGSCRVTDTTTFFQVSCTTLPDNLNYFGWAQCTDNIWGFGPTEPGTSGIWSKANCPGNLNLHLIQGGVNFGSAAGQGSCPADTIAGFSVVACTALPYNLAYFAWVQCTNNKWGFGPAEPGNSNINSYAYCPVGSSYVQGGFNIG